MTMVSCASAVPDSKKAALDEPQIQITQLSNIAEAARHMTGNISVQYRVDVENRAKVPITLKRIDIVSLGAGAYNLRPTSAPFSEQLNPGETRAVQIWAPAFIDNPTIIGANGPVTVRATVYYDSPLGTSQSIVVQQVNTSAY
ncbi:MAG TPA: hypothetical protein VER58_19040 [Thermoanaerobaculia bacterium]|nr:hypothetical protein [Thermoanaerobaculia bacterium]